jgi:hypothetical protein
MKLLATGGTRSLDAFQCLMKGILGQVLAFFPIAGQAIDGVKDQFVVFLNKFFYRLSGKRTIHTLLFIRVAISRDTYEDAQEGEFVTELSMQKATKENWIFGRVSLQRSESKNPIFSGYRKCSSM